MKGNDAKRCLGHYGSTLAVLFLIPSLALPEESSIEKCRAAFSSLAGEVIRTRGLRLFVRDVKDGDPISIRDGFFGVTKPARALPHYESLAGRVARTAVKTPLYFVSLLDGVHHAAVNKPVGWASEKAGFKRKRTTWLTEGILFSLAGGLAALTLDEEKEKKMHRELAEHGELIDQLIASDFRMEGIRQLLIQKRITRDEARKMAYLLLEEYKNYYLQPEREFIKKAGVLPHDIEFESLPEDTRKKLTDINHLLFLEYRVIAEIEGVSKDGKLTVSADLQEPNINRVLDHIQGPEETFTKSLIQLYQEGHNGKSIELSSLKRFLMYDAWVRAIDYGETAVGRDGAETVLRLREEGIEDLRGYLVPQK